MNSFLLILIGGLSLIVFVLSALRKRKHEETNLSGFALWQSVDGWVNYVLYPMVIASLGVLIGGAIMIGVTLVGNIVYILVNNATTSDWTYMSLITYLRDATTHYWPLRYFTRKKFLPFSVRRWIAIYLCGCIRRLLRLKHSKAIVFTYLSLWRDSFYAMIFLYHKKVDLRKPTVLSLFLISHILCNLGWLPVSWALGAAGKFILDAITSIL